MLRREKKTVGRDLIVRTSRNANREDQPRQYVLSVCGGGPRLQKKQKTEDQPKIEKFFARTTVSTAPAGGLSGGVDVRGGGGVGAAGGGEELPLGNPISTNLCRACLATLAGTEEVPRRL